MLSNFCAWIPVNGMRNVICLSTINSVINLIVPIGTFYFSTSINQLIKKLSPENPEFEPAYSWTLQSLQSHIPELLDHIHLTEWSVSTLNGFFYEQVLHKIMMSIKVLIYKIKIDPMNL